MNVQDKVVIITGAAGDIGSTVSHAFKAAGAKLALIDRAEDRLQEQCGSIEGAALLGGIDLTVPEDTERMAQQTVDTFGRIDALINIAGGYRAGDPTWETDVKTWDFLMNLNAKSVFLAARAVAPHMIEAGEGGKIVSFAAKAGLVRGAKGASAYSASKAAVIRVTEALSQELREHRINVNCVVPSLVNTEGNRNAMPDANHEAWATPAQLAKVLMFLASDESNAVNGASIAVYGYA